MNYEVRKVTTMGWSFPPYTSSQFGDDVKWATNVYVNTHGAILPNSNVGDPRRTTFFNADGDDLTPSWLEGITDPAMLPEGISITGSFAEPRISPLRQTANGSGYPPHNDGGPPISLAWLDGCQCGLGEEDFDSVTRYPFRQEFSGAFLHPLRTSYDAFTANQSFCSFRIQVITSYTRPVAIEFYSKLLSGWTVHRARVFAFNMYQASNRPADPEDWMAVYGDFGTRLHGVYTYSDDPFPVTDWYR